MHRELANIVDIWFRIFFVTIKLFNGPDNMTFNAYVRDFPESKNHQIFYG